MPLVRALVVLALAAFSVSLLAQQPTTDLYARVVLSESRVPSNTKVFATIEFGWEGNALVRQNQLEIDVPGELIHLSGNDPRITCTTDVRPVRCTVGLESLEFHGLVGFETRLVTPGNHTFGARISSTTAETRLSNNQDTDIVEVVGLPWLHVSTGATAGRFEPGQQVTYQTYVQNLGARATNIRTTMRITGGATFTAVRAEGATTCTLAPTEIVCMTPALDYPLAFSVFADARMPDRLTGGVITVTSFAVASEGDYNGVGGADSMEGQLARYMVVSNTNDEGAGSLRQALLDTQQFCADAWCAVVFRIAGTPQNGRFVIQPRSGLPEVRGYVRIDGATQTAFGGDTNPAGPEIEIDGALAGQAHGLLLGSGCEIWVTDLAITRFAWPGIEARRGPYPFGQCRTSSQYTTVIARNEIRGNYRGLVVVDSAYAQISDNVIDGNQRAGLYASGNRSIPASNFFDIRRNRVTNNGASGMFFDIGSRAFITSGAHIEENEISGNAEWGIARTDNGDLTIRRNSIHDNRYLAIDAGLDFETPNRTPDDRQSVPNKPVLFSAQYDPAANKTVVRGHLTTTIWPSLGGGTEIDFYASDSLSRAGQAEAETFLLSHRVSSGNFDGDFTVEVEGDLRGKFITAATVRTRFVGFAKPPDVTSESHQHDSPADTSELSNVVRVF